ncbi:Hypothetical protein NTJ_01338 [Nesidiocoris tenuis]|uniref:Uncharacterized protein n=1 Tax=Nesidiocoris tenuis TaxID=355587 RepID=A0ABN7ABD8_9HEMI|nr:Hypothetical protein NTJ_01338 [Nesidiocoris tenuis]
MGITVGRRRKSIGERRATRENAEAEQGINLFGTGRRESYVGITLRAPEECSLKGARCDDIAVPRHCCRSKKRQAGRREDPGMFSV